MLIKNQLKLDAGGEGANSGGGGGSSGGAGGAGQGTGASGANGGGGLLSGAGSGGTGAGAGAAGGQNTGAQGGAGSSEIKFPENWKMGLPQELQESPALKVVHDIPSLAKSYINAQKLVGADKIPLPSKHATPEEWRAVQMKLGLPEKKEDYKVEAPKDSSLGTEFVPQLAAKAHEIGILPQHLQALVGWMSDANKTALDSLKKNQEIQLKEGIEGLQKEWGSAYQEKLSDAQKALSHFADKETIAHLDKTGLSNDIQLVKLFSKVAEILKEDGIVKGNGTGSGGMTPAAAREARNAIMADFNHPYYQKDHPNHKAALAEVTRLFAMEGGKQR